MANKPKVPKKVEAQKETKKVGRPKKEDAEKKKMCCLQITKDCKTKKGFKLETEFSTMKTGMFEKSIPFCKECMEQFIKDEYGLVDINKLALLLRTLDLPLLKEAFDYAHEGNGKHTSFISAYLTKVANLKIEGEKGKVKMSWVDSDIEIEGMQKHVAKKNVDELDILEDKEAIEELYKEWGYQYALKDLVWLENNYAEWIKSHDSDKLSSRKMMRMICRKELEIMKLQANGKSSDRQEKQLLELMKNANLTPKTMGEINASDDMTKCLGLWIKDIEAHRPAEYFKDKSIYKDYDGIGSYYERFILRPLKNLIVGSREFDREFQSIEFEDESNYDQLDEDELLNTPSDDDEGDDLEW